MISDNVKIEVKQNLRNSFNANQDKQTVLIYLQSIVAILNQTANFPADMEIIDNYLAMAKIFLANYTNTVLENGVSK